MRRLLLTVFLLLAVTGAHAQTATPQPGDPPVLARISISPPRADGTVTITGANGAVFANAYLAIRNLYTGETVYQRAGSTGSFSASLYGPGNTPFWISPTDQRIPPEDQNTPGSLPGGPSVIVYGQFGSALPGHAVTPIAIDGDLSDWSAFSDATLFDAGSRAVYGLRNADSLYLAFSGVYVNDAYTQLELRFTVDLNTYTLTLDPRQARPAAFVQVNPAHRDLGTLIVAAHQGSAIELRIPLSFVSQPNRVSLEAVRWLDANGVEISHDTIAHTVTARAESDGIFRSHSLLGQDATLFSLAGAFSNGSIWSAQGRIGSLDLQPGGQLRLELDLSAALPDLPANVQMIGAIALQPVARRVDGQMRAVGGLSTNNGWSSILTPSGLPIDNLTSSVPLGEAVAAPFQLVRTASGVSFPLDFSLLVPGDLPPGLYVPFFQGYIQTGDGGRTAWSQDDSLPARLPLVLSIGGVKDARLLWTLFADNPSDGSRGVLPAEDRAYAALSNRVRFDSPTTILPPTVNGTAAAYPLEPYLLDELPNRYDASAAPLIPFDFPNGQITARVQRPDGTVDDVGSVDIAQDQLSTALADERTRFGAQSPLDEFRLTTLDPRLAAYRFDQYGEYTITLTGSLQDHWGHTYEGGGTYKILSAQVLDLTPGVLPGTPFEVGDSFYAGLHLSPGVPADITVTVEVYPLDGSVARQHTISGQANAHGFFDPVEKMPLVFTQPGEYVVDYEARYKAPDGRLWAASLRGAGVIGEQNGAIVAHGERGVPGVVGQPRPAWFDAHQYAQTAGITSDLTRLFFPYHSGDVVWINDGQSGGLVPEIRAQDLSLSTSSDAYAPWITAILPDYVSDSGLTIHQLADEGELPIAVLSQQSYGPALLPDRAASQSYTYISAVRPNVTVRQFVSGGDSGGLLLSWDEDDPLNQQIGAGINGDRPGDVVFLFGGTVIRAAQIRHTAIYGALEVVGSTPPRVYPPDRGTAGGGDGGPLLTLNNQQYDTFIDLTGLQPGEVLTVGDTATLAGQVAPTLPAQVTATFSSPSGRVFQRHGTANAIGAYVDPADPITFDEPGVWTVDVQVTLAGATSAGQIDPPAPQGGLLGAPNGRFSVYVLPPNTDPLPWNPLLSDVTIPIVSPYNFSFTLPSDWSKIQAYYTLGTPGMVIEQGALHVNGRSVSYAYTAPLQSLAFPNLENEGHVSGDYVADVRTLTIVALGVDANGQQQIRSRTFTLMNDHLITVG